MKTMWKYLLLFTIANIVKQGIVQAQVNLVPNPSFEIYNTCPTSISSGIPDQVAYATGWWTSKGTPDYYNACAPLSSGASVPTNELGSQLAATGNAYCGMLGYYQGGNWREIITSQLNSIMVIGQTYYVSFKVSFAGRYCNYGIANNKMGIKFSTVHYDTASPPPIDNTAHIYSSSIITDTTNWIMIKGIFIADSAYKYINLGIFYDDAHTDTLHVDSSCGDSYYYYDDICVSIDSNSCFSSLSVLEFSLDKIKIFPNPANDLIQIEQNNNQIGEVIIFNELGQSVVKYENVKEHHLTVDCSKWSNGIYLIKTKKQIKKLIINHKL